MEIWRGGLGCAQSPPPHALQPGWEMNHSATPKHPVKFIHPSSSQLSVVLSGIGPIAHSISGSGGQDIGLPDGSKQCLPPRAPIAITDQNKQLDKVFPHSTLTWRNNKSQHWPENGSQCTCGAAHTLLAVVITFDPVFNVFLSELEPRCTSQQMEGRMYFG